MNIHGNTSVLSSVDVAKASMNRIMRLRWHNGADSKYLFCGHTQIVGERIVFATAGSRPNTSMAKHPMLEFLQLKATFVRTWECGSGSEAGRQLAWWFFVWPWSAR